MIYAKAVGNIRVNSKIPSGERSTLVFYNYLYILGLTTNLLSLWKLINAGGYFDIVRN